MDGEHGEVATLHSAIHRGRTGSGSIAPNVPGLLLPSGSSAATVRGWRTDRGTRHLGWAEGSVRARRLVQHLQCLRHEVSAITACMARRSVDSWLHVTCISAIRFSQSRGVLSVLPTLLCAPQRAASRGARARPSTPPSPLLRRSHSTIKPLTLDCSSSGRTWSDGAGALSKSNYRAWFQVSGVSTRPRPSGPIDPQRWRCGDHSRPARPGC